MEAGNICGMNSMVRGSQVCHSEERSDVGISCSRLRFRRGLPAIQHGTARLPRRLRLLAMTSQGNTAVHQRPSAVELPRTGRSVSALQAGNIQGMYFMA